MIFIITTVRFMFPTTLSWQLQEILILNPCWRASGNYLNPFLLDEPARLARQEPAAKWGSASLCGRTGRDLLRSGLLPFPTSFPPRFLPTGVLDSLLAGPSNLNMFSGGISNKTSRLYRALVDKEIRCQCPRRRAGNDRSVHVHDHDDRPSQRKPEEALAALDKEIQRVKEESFERGDHPSDQTGACLVCLRQREHHQPGILDGLCRDVCELRMVRNVS